MVFLIFNKCEIIKKVKSLNINNYIVMNGGAMVMRGYREYATDIDLQVSYKDFRILSDGLEIKRGMYTGDKSVILCNGEVEIFEGIHDDIDYTIIDGINVKSDDSVIKYKFISGRDKDFHDIKLIKNTMPPR